MQARLPYYQRTHPLLMVPSKKDAIEGLISAMSGMLPMRACKVLSLPGPWWNFERSLSVRLQRHGRHFAFTGCEKERLIFDVACHRMPHKRRQEDRGCKQKFCAELGNADVMTNGHRHCAIHCDVFDWLKVTEKRYDLIYLDLCSPLTPSILDGLEIAADKVVSGGVFALSFMAARESLKMLKRMYPYKSRQKFLRDWLEAADLRLRSSWAWNDGSPMFQMLFRKAGDSSAAAAPSQPDPVAAPEVRA